MAFHEQTCSGANAAGKVVEKVFRFFVGDFCQRFRFCDSVMFGNCGQNFVLCLCVGSGEECDGGVHIGVVKLRLP